MSVMHTPIDTTIEIRVGQVWSAEDPGGKRRKFRITSLKPFPNKTIVYGTYLASGRFIGVAWTVTKLQRGFRKARLEADSEGVVDFKPPTAAPAKEKPMPKMGLALPKGITRAEARREVDRARVRFGDDARAISVEVGFATVVVEALLSDLRRSA